MSGVWEGMYLGILDFRHLLTEVVEIRGGTQLVDERREIEVALCARCGGGAHG